MFKRALVAASVAAVFAAPAFADVSISGSAEMDLFYRTNNTADGDGKLLQEIAIVINVDGKDKLDSGDTLSWRLAQKVATPDRFDSWGIREAWIAYGGSWGTLKFGNQWSDTYLIQDWPYGSKGFSGTVGEVPNTGFAQGITYATPSFGGFNGSIGYDFVDGTLDDAYAWEIAGHLALGSINFDAGYYASEDALPQPQGVANWNTLTTKANRWDGGVNPDCIDDTAVVGNQCTSGGGEGSSFNNWIVGARGSFGDFAFRAAVRGANRTSNDVVAGAQTGTTTDIDQIGYLLGGTYSFGKQALSLGYFWQEADVEGADDDDNTFQTIGFQWDYALSKNTGAFVQIRHNMVGDDWNGAIWQNADGLADGDNSTRFLVGTWTGF